MSQWKINVENMDIKECIILTRASCTAGSLLTCFNATHLYWPFNCFYLSIYISPQLQINQFLSALSSFPLKHSVNKIFETLSAYSSGRNAADLKHTVLVTHEWAGNSSEWGHHHADGWRGRRWARRLKEYTSDSRVLKVRKIKISLPFISASESSSDAIQCW